ncbi:MAG: threonine aldolase family protein [Hyphomicrobiales bacterium]
MIDLRSDILAPCPQEALTAMLAAASDPPGFGHKEDPHQRLLEEELSAAFGFEDALFVPTGTVANQIAIRVWCAPGEAIVAERESHVATNEASSTAGLNSVALRLIAGEYGHLAPSSVARALAAQDESSPGRKTCLVWLENTHNRAGGTVMPQRWMTELVDICRSANVPIHVDGARVWNAAVASGTQLHEVARGASSLTASLNKAVGAPAGALLMGSKEFIEEAARVQKMFGGLWRPVGMLAAAAIIAARNFRPRTEADHESARCFAAILDRRLGGSVSITKPQTNIVMLDLSSPKHTEALISSLKGRGVAASRYGDSRLRFVLHAGISALRAAEAAECIAAEIVRFLSPDSQIR